MTPRGRLRAARPRVPITGAKGLAAARATCFYQHGLTRPSLAGRPRARSSSVFQRPIRAASRRAADLEAFSHRPSDDSFAALPGRAAANTKYPARMFLSYLFALLLPYIHQ